MPVKIFFCYAHEDEPLLNKFKTHLRPLQREGLIDIWYDRNISAGAEWGREIDKHLNEADIILLLISPDFMNSDYIFGVELARATERHVNNEAHIIPIILRPATWQGLLGRFQALPKDGRPVKSRHWHNMDEAFSDIAQGIRKAISVLPHASQSAKKVTTLQPVTEQVISNDIPFFEGATLTPEQGEKIKQSLHLTETAYSQHYFSGQDMLDNLKQDISEEPTFRPNLEPIPLLIIKVGKEPGRTYEIHDTLTLGRKRGSGIFLEDIEVSRQHASISRNDSGIYLLKDTGSANGTKVNNQILKRDQEYMLRDGDEIQLGQTILVFSYKIGI